MKTHRVAKSLAFRSLVLVAGLAAGLGPTDAGALGPRARRQWTLETTADSKLYELDLLETSGGSLWGNSLRVPRAGIQGLPGTGLEANQTGVTLRFKRDAGTIVATGSIRGGRGEGSFEVELDPAYAAELERRGVGRPSADQQRRLLHADASFGFLDVLKANGYPVPGVDLLMRCVDHGVDEDFIRELAAAGYRLDSIESLVRVRDHGVDADFIREMAAAGIKDLQIEDLVRARDHGVDATFAKHYQRRHGNSVTLDELIHARDLGG